MSFEVGDEFEETKSFDFENYTKPKENRKRGITIFSIPESLKTGFQQYMLFFKDYVKTAKGIDIKFDVKQVPDGLEIETESEAHHDLLQEYFEEYMDFARKNFVGIINVEGNPKPESIDILRMRLEQQVHNLNMEMKFKDLQIKSLEEQVTDNKKEKFLLLGMISNTYNDKNIQKIKLLDGSMGLSDLRNSCKALIGKDKLKEVFEVLQEYANENMNSDSQSDLIVLNNRWAEFKRSQIRTPMSLEEKSRNKAGIVNGLLNFIELM
ncbi:MAG: hypothetical protein AAF960_17850 [Bacteroidota bacterium]